MSDASAAEAAIGGRGSTGDIDWADTRGEAAAAELQGRGISLPWLVSSGPRGAAEPDV